MMNVFLFACIEMNIGDDLFVKTICERYPSTDFIITSKAEYGSLAKIENLHFSETLSNWNWASSAGEDSNIKFIIGKIMQKYYEFRLPKSKTGVCIVGNTFKNKKYTGWKQSRWMRERINLVDRFYILSTNFGPYNDDRWKFDFDKIFPQIYDICFREKYSLDLFSDIENVRYAPDAIFSLGYQEHDINNNVIISLLDCSLDARGDDLKRAASMYEQKMVECIKILKDKGYDITLLNSNTEQDRPACNRIINKVGANEVTIFDYDGDLESVFKLYKESSYIIGTRLHSIILGFLFKLKVLPIIYDIKVSNMLESCLYSGSSFDIKKLDDVDSNKIITELENSNFILSDSIIEDSNNQFLKLDEILY